MKGFAIRRTSIDAGKTMTAYLVDVPGVDFSWTEDRAEASLFGFWLAWFYVGAFNIGGTAWASSLPAVFCYDAIPLQGSP